MNKWIAEFDLEDGDTMPEHMDLEYKGAKIDFHCKPLEQEPILDKLRAEIEEERVHDDWDFGQEIYYNNAIDDVLQIIDKYRNEVSE